MRSVVSNMDIKALKKLRKFIKNLPEESFDWGSFMNSDRHGSLSDRKHTEETIKHMKDIAKTGEPMCNTIGCIAGWGAIRHPKRLKFDKHGVLCSVKDFRLVEEDAFAFAYGLTEEQGQRVVYGFANGYDNSREGAMQCLTDLIEGRIDEEGNKRDN